MKRKRKGGMLSTMIISAIFIAGLGVLLYPTVSDYWNSFHQSRAIMDYSQSMSGISEAEYARYLGEAEAYNRVLSERGITYALSDAQIQEYDSLLDVGGNGVMGYVEVPVINVSLPIYHGTSEAVLQTAIGHLEWSSLPVGGESTHSVLSGHRGLPSARLFTDLDRVVKGDIFLIYVLNRILTYEVDQIDVVLPEEVNSLQISRGQDYCTLITCTPYGINTHRLLVRGHRIANADGAVTLRVAPDGMQVDRVLAAPFVVAPLLLVLGLWAIGDGRYREGYQWDPEDYEGLGGEGLDG